MLHEGCGYLAALYNAGDMAVRIEMQNTGDPRTRGEIVAILEHVLSDRPGEWRVSIIGSHANDNWEMKVEGPAGFEHSYTLVGAGESRAGGNRKLGPEAAAGEEAVICHSGSHPFPNHADIGRLLGIS